MSDRIAIAYGDGIGPEIMESVLAIFRAAKVNLSIDIIEVGNKLYSQGFESGISPSSWETVLNNKILLKAPITTPSGGGYKSLNVTFRKGLGLYANVRPIRSYAPYIESYSDNADVVIVRENEEDLYAGIEYRLTEDTYQSLKLVTRQGCEKIINYAFDYAVKHGRKKVTCTVKDNIMKMTDGLFASVFDEISQKYPDIQSDKIIVDIGTGRMAKYPESFDVIVTMNLYGDIISDVIAEMLGSVGMCGSANIGDDFAMFEAIHGSAPDIAGKNIANPSGLINASIMMLRHLKMFDQASLIENALFKTIEDGIHTTDMFNSSNSKQKVSTTEFTDALIERLGQKSLKIHSKDIIISEKQNNLLEPKTKTEVKNRVLVGIDLYIFQNYANMDELVVILENLPKKLNLQLQMISSRGLQIWPVNVNENEISDLLRCRFVSKNPDKLVYQKDILELLDSCINENIEVVKSESLYVFDGKLGFSLSQGQ